MARDSLFTYFTTVLYLDNVLQRTFIQSVDNCMNFTGLKIAYILHDKCKFLPGDIDRDTDEPIADHLVGKLKKAHWHLFMKSGYPMTEKTFCSSFGALVKLPPKRIQGVRNPSLFCAYLTHTDPDSVMKGKQRYNLIDFRGDVQILSVSDDLSIVDFYNAVYEWRTGVSDSESTFAALTLALHFAGFTPFIKRNQFICTRIMSEAVQMRREAAFALLHPYNPAYKIKMEELPF